MSAFDEICQQASYDLHELINCTNPRTGGIGIPGATEVTFRTITEPDKGRVTDTLDGGQGYGVYRNEARAMLATFADYVEDGTNSYLTGNGRAAYDTALRFFVSPGDEIIVAPGDAYTGFKGLIEKDYKKINVTFKYVDGTREALEQAYVPGKTRLVFTETITNPLLQVADLRLITDFAKEHGLISIADNTAAPLAVRPLHHGFDVVVDSLTKYFGGYGNVTGGAITINKDRQDLAIQLKDMADRTGPAMSAEVAEKYIPLAAGFPLRLKVFFENALHMARALKNDERIKLVRYPGLESDPGHALALAQNYAAFGGLVSFELQGERQDALRFAQHFNTSNVVTVADSFGIAYRPLLNFMPGQSGRFKAMKPEERAAQGIGETFFRFAAACTDPKKVEHEIKRGLDFAFPVTTATVDLGTNARHPG